MVLQVWCKPGEALPKANRDQLKKCKRDEKTNDEYLTELCTVFGNRPEDLLKVSHESKLILGGFIAGEGSFNISARKTTTARFGVVITPEFSITQHVNGVCYLLLALKIFKIGAITHKNQSNATIVYRIGALTSLKDTVEPFWRQYIRPSQSPGLIAERDKFLKVLDILMDKSKNTSVDTFLYEVLPLWDSLRKQKGQSNEAFRDLASAQTYVRNFVKNKKLT